MKREEKIIRLKHEIDKYVANGGSIQDENKKLPYFNLLKVLLRSDRNDGIESSISSVYKECGYNYVEKRKPLTIERIKQEIDEYVANGGSIFDAWDVLPYRSAMSSFISLNDGWDVKKVYEACGYEYKDKPLPVTLDRLKKAIDEYVANGGSIYDSREKLPYIILMNNYVRNNKDRGMDIQKAYQECGYDYDLKKTPITIERIKEEIDKYIANGGDIYGKSTDIPYYEMIQHFIERYRRNGVKYSVEEVYKMCGYDYDSMYYNVYKLGSALKDYKDQNGYVDSLKETERGRSLYERLRKKAQALELDLNDYLMCMFGVKMKHAYSSLDYVSLVEEKLHEHEQMYGRKCVNLNHISRYNPKLLNRIRHLAMYFPEGSISMNDVLYYFDYEDVKKKVKPLSEDDVLNKLEELYPTKEVTNLSSHGGLYMKLVRLSVSKNITIEKYLVRHGYKPTKSQDVYRLSKAMVNVDKDKYEQICFLRKDMISKSKVLNSPNSTVKEVNAELERIGLEIVEIMHIEQKPLIGKSKR